MAESEAEIAELKQEKEEIASKLLQCGSDRGRRKRQGNEKTEENYKRDGREKCVEVRES